jgi:plasmid stabilization system protein ParE
VILLSDVARADLREQLDYLDERNPTAAAELLEKLYILLAKLDARAFDGPTEQLKTGERVQSWPLPPLRIYYQRDGEVLYVVHVHHQRRRPIVRRPRRRKP